MCLAIPGQVISVIEHDDIIRTGQVDFGGVVKEINLSFTPEATIGAYVLVHVGFSISVIDAEEAGRIFDHLRQMEAPNRHEGETGR